VTTPPKDSPDSPIPRLLLVAAALAIVGGIVGARGTTDYGFTTQDVVVVAAFLGAVIFVTLAGLAYLLRQHERWRDHLRRRDE